MSITSLFSAVQTTQSPLTAVGIAIASMLPFWLVIPVADFWFLLNPLIRIVAAFGLGVLRASIVKSLSERSPGLEFELLVAGLFAAFWWVAVQHTLNEESRLARRFQLLTGGSRRELSFRMAKQGSARQADNFSQIQHMMDVASTKKDTSGGFETLALAALESEIASETRKMGLIPIQASNELPRVKFPVSWSKVLSWIYFDVRFAGFAFGAMAVVGSAQAYPLDRTLLSVPLSVLIFVSVLLLSNRLSAKPKTATVTFVLLASAISLPVVIPDALLVLLGYESGISDWRVAIGTPSTLFAIAIASSVLSFLQRSHAELLQNLAVRLSDQELIALYLHNSMKSELIALALRIQSSQVPSFKLKAWEELKLLLAQNISEEALKSQAQPLERFTRVLAAWSPILEIDAKEFIESAASSSALACRFLEEAIANAARHAKASKVKISVSSKASKWILTVASDGRAEISEGNLGFGFRALEQAADKWTLTSGSSGSLLTIHLLHH